MATALVIGGGIGGLTAAVALRQAGWDVQLFERQPAIREVGAGITVQANAMTALATLGLAAGLIERGHRFDIGFLGDRHEVFLDATGQQAVPVLRGDVATDPFGRGDVERFLQLGAVHVRTADVTDLALLDEIFERTEGKILPSVPMR